ncbi:MAG: UPF0182 family protein [Actinomycetota bacterium]|nr:UPF0182 family protein [Actinomycetota bacterium]
MAVRLQRRPGNRRLRGIVIGVIVALVISISTIVSFYTDLLWYREVHFSQVFLKILYSKVLLAVGFGVVFFVIAFVNMLVVSRLMPPFRVGDPRDPLERYRVTLLPYFRRFAFAISAFLAFVFAIGVAAEWDKVLLALNAKSFGITDPIFHRDIGFYVFRFPVYQFIYTWLFSSLVIIGLLIAGAHYLTGGIRAQGGLGRLTPQVKAHLSVFIGLIAILKAWGYRLDQYRLLYSTRGDITGATYTDVHAHLPALKLLMIISIVAAILFIVNIRFRGWSLPIFGVGLWLLTGILAGRVFPYIVQKFTVVPAQIQKESGFLKRSIEFTRHAYGLDSIAVREYPAEPSVTAQTISDNGPTVKNIRLFDPDILKTAYKQLQEIRTYYEFNDVDVDRYQVNGEVRQVMLSTRELNLTPLDNLTWQNNHLFYTHGYGAVVSPTNETSTEGQPSFLVQDIPPASKAPELKITKGGIYFGEGLSDYSVVKTKQKELDFEEQDRSQLTTYSGPGGVKVNGFSRRLAFAWRFRDPNLLISGLIDKNSRILYYRQIRERLEKAAPFLAFDGDPYPAIIDGKIVWIADGYTTSSLYPYSESLNFGDRTGTDHGTGPPTIDGPNNYIRNSVKATIDAYDGTVKFYLWDNKDPIINAWRSVFPSLFSSKDAMPKAVLDHVRYPEDLFRIQSFVYRRYHVTDPSTFFFRQDAWVTPRDPNVGEGIATVAQSEEVQPYYVLMKLPDQTSEDYNLILPMNPKDRPNMVSYLTANSGPDDYGKLVDFRFPKTRQIFGVGQIHSRINATESISREITLLSQQGSQVRFGNLLVVPIGKSILYVQPLFLQADKNAIPELKFVILATKDQVVLGTSLDDAIKSLIEGGGSPLGPETPSTPSGNVTKDEAIRQALQHFLAGEQALKRGDFATYGKERDLEKASLDQANGTSPSPSPSASP